MVPQKHPARPRLVISRSSGTAESRTWSADFPFMDQTSPFIHSPTVSVSMQNTMARTKRTARYANSDGSSFYVPVSETSEQAPDAEITQGDSVAQSSEEGARVAPSNFVVDMVNQQTAPVEEEGSAPSGEESDSSNNESSSSSSSRLSLNSEERDSRLHEARLSHAVEKGDEWSEPSASNRELNTPYFCHVPKGRIKAMKEKLYTFLSDHEMGPNFNLFVPDPEDAVVWPETISYGDACFGCYEAAIKAGLRFPLHPAVQKILDGYEVGLWQLAPNSWFNILGYVAGCEMYRVEPNFEAFTHMNYLSRTPKASGTGWYQLTSHKGFLMTRGKENKWKDWRNTFYLIQTSDPLLNKRYNRWNRNPPLLAGGAGMPPVPRQARGEILDRGLFKVKTQFNPTSGAREQVPLYCIPEFKWLYDEYFLAACGLSSRASRGSRHPTSFLYSF